MEDGLAVPIVMFAGLTLVGIVFIVSKAVTRVATHYADVSLKTRMVEAGLPASEIERVVNAGRVGKKVADTAAVRSVPASKPPVAKTDAPSYGTASTA